MLALVLLNIKNFKNITVCVGLYFCFEIKKQKTTILKKISKNIRTLDLKKQQQLQIGSNHAIQRSRAKYHFRFNTTAAAATAAELIIRRHNGIHFTFLCCCCCYCCCRPPSFFLFQGVLAVAQHTQEHAEILPALPIGVL